MHTLRVKKLKAVIKQWGGPASLAKKLGHSNSSYLSQLVSGHRPFSEKTARKMESELGLPTGWFDRENSEATITQAAKVDTSLVNRVVLAVTGALNDAGVRLAPAKFADLVTLVYDQASNSGEVDAAFLTNIVQLLKKE